MAKLNSLAVIHILHQVGAAWLVRDSHVRAMQLLVVFVRDGLRAVYFPSPELA